MPSEIYGTLYNQHDLNTVITMVKDIYEKKPEPANPPTTNRGVTAPFTLIKAPNGSSKRVHFQEGERIDKLIETLYQMDMEGKPTKKPYKPYITSPRHRGGRGGFRSRGGHSSSDRGKGWPRPKGRFRGGRGGFPHRGRFQGRKFDKSPTMKRPRVSSKAEDKDKIDVIIAIRGDISQPIALREIRLSLRSLPKEKSLKITLTPMEVKR